MPDLDFAILCDYCREAEGLMFISAAGIDHLALKTPTLVDVGLAFRLLFTSNECGRPHRLEAIFQDMDGHRLVALNATAVPPPPPPEYPPHWPVNLPLAIRTKLPIPAPGEYSLHVLINDEEKRTINLLALDAPDEP